MENNKLERFLKSNPGRYEIFHEGYRRGIIAGFTTALERTSSMLKEMKEIQEEKL